MCVIEVEKDLTVKDFFLFFDKNAFYNLLLIIINVKKKINVKT